MLKQIMSGVVVVCSGAASAQLFEAFDASGDLGSIEAFVSATDIAGSYNFHSEIYNGINPSRGQLIANAVNVFMVDATDGIGFFTVFSNAAAAGGRFDGMVNYTSIETMVVEDDANDQGWNAGDSGMDFVLAFVWNANRTDGWASTFDTTEGSSATISATNVDDANVIVWHSADGSMIRSTDVLGGGFGVRVVPAPSAAMAIGLGLAFGSRRRR